MSDFTAKRNIRRILCGRTLSVLLCLCSLLSVCGCAAASDNAQDSPGTTADTYDDAVTAASSNAESAEDNAYMNTEHFDSEGRFTRLFVRPDGTVDDAAAKAASDMLTARLPDGWNSGKNGTVFYVDLASVIAGMSETDAYDAANFVACLQGLLNREHPTLFVDYYDSDWFWFRWLHYDENKLLWGYKTQAVDTLDDLLDAFDVQISSYGLSLWDPAVPATLDALTTACGVEGFLPVCAGSELYERLKKRGYEVKLDLTGCFTGSGTIYGTNTASTGSAKCDVYLWAADRYMAKTSAAHMGYILDGDAPYGDINNSFCTNRDYLVAEKCFVFDLSPWGDEEPCDDPDQPLGTDLATFKTVMQAHYDLCGGAITQVHGFTPWHFKYTRYGDKGKHGEVESEWEHARILTAYNSVMDADAAGYCGMADASLYRLYKLSAGGYANNRPKNKTAVENGKVYVLIYMGDYDSAAWLSRFVPQWFTDSARGEVPLNWAFDPNLSQRAPMVFDYIYSFKTSEDYFITGDSGAGYLNPSLLINRHGYSENPDGTAAWINWNKSLLNFFDMSVCGFCINGSYTADRKVTELYSQIFATGSLYNGLYKDIASDGGTLHKNMDNIGLPSDPAEAAKTIVSSAAAQKDKPVFFAARTVLFSPTQIKEIEDEVGKISPDYVFCDAYTYFDLIAQSLGQ